ncbi:MAG: hypothetical protein GX781_04495 [Clostridiales bacterium]|nr:hypothetical protein [Clostridiales bacterium]
MSTSGNKWRMVVGRMSDESNKKVNQAAASNPSELADLADKKTNTEKPYGFYGSYMHSVDAKGRMIVPQSFREHLGVNIVISLNMSQTSVAIYPHDIWEKKIDMLTDLSEEDVSAEVFLERFAMFSFDNIGFDTQGRVLIPAILRDNFLRNASSVQISGARDYLKVISSQQASEEIANFNLDYPDVLRDISRIQDRLRSQAKK